MDTSARRARLRARLTERELDALLVTRLVNVRYLTGFTGSNATLLVTQGDELLVTDGRYELQAGAEIPDVPLRIARGDDWLAETLDGVGRLGLESHDVTWDRLRALQERLEGMELVPAGREVEALRAVKDDGELAALARASTITVRVLAELPAWLRPGLSERAVARRVEAELLDAGADGIAFATIVASGPNGAYPHHRPTDRVIGAGDLVTVDCGALVQGDHADMTRTVAVGEPGSELRGLYEVVRQAQRAGVAAVTEGAAAGDVDAAARAVLEAAGHAEHVAHPTGHAVGLEIHEPPILRCGETVTLRSRMTVTVEPGLYVPGLGGVRIEDLVAVTARGRDVLTAAPTDLLVC